MRVMARDLPSNGCVSLLLIRVRIRDGIEEQPNEWILERNGIRDGVGVIVNVGSVVDREYHFRDRTTQLCNVLCHCLVFG